MSLGGCGAGRSGRLFGACSLGAAGTGMLPAYYCARQVFHKTRPAEEGLQSPASESHKE